MSGIPKIPSTSRASTSPRATRSPPRWNLPRRPAVLLPSRITQRGLLLPRRFPDSLLFASTTLSGSLKPLIPTVSPPLSGNHTMAHILLSIDIPFANFGSVTFTDTKATTTSGSTVGPSGATIFDIEQSQILTSCSASSSSVTCSYV